MQLESVKWTRYHPLYSETSSLLNETYIRYKGTNLKKLAWSYQVAIWAISILATDRQKHLLIVLVYSFLYKNLFYNKVEAEIWPKI